MFSLYHLDVRKTVLRLFWITEKNEAWHRDDDVVRVERK